MKKIVYIDMDDVMVNYQSGIDRLDEKIKQKYEGQLDNVPGLFGLMDPLSGAVESVRKLSEYYDLYVLSTAPWRNPSAWMDKVKWIQKYFGDTKESIFYKRIIITHHKNLLTGDILIDDREKNGVKDFKGEHLLFGSEKFPNWQKVTDYLIEKTLE